MIYRRAERFGAKTKPVVHEEITHEVAIEEEVAVEETVDPTSLDWNDLKAYAKQQGVDLAIHKSKADIIAQLTK